MAFYQWKLSIGNVILSVEIFHGKWHFINRNCPQEMAFCQWKFSIGNSILPVETFHRKWHFTNGNFPCLTAHLNGNNGTLLLNAILPVETFHRK